MAERLRSRSSGGKFRGCVSVVYRWRGERRLPESFRIERGSRSLIGFEGDFKGDFTGDLDDDLLVDGDDEKPVLFT